MAFGKKKTTVQFDQGNVAMLATQALAKSRLVQVRLAIKIVFLTPILMQQWTQKAVVQWLGKMVGQPQPRGPKDLVEDYEASWYRNLDDKAVIPCRVMKACIISGAIGTGGVVSKAQLNRELRVMGHTSPLTLSGPMQMDTRIAKNDNGGPDMRSRALIPAGSSAEFVLGFPTTTTPDQVVAALSAAGEIIGLSEWRPEKGGEWGQFRVEWAKGDDKTIERILKACSVPEKTYSIPPEMLRAFATIPADKVPDGLNKAMAVHKHANGQKRNGAGARA